MTDGTIVLIGLCVLAVVVALAAGEIRDALTDVARAIRGKR